MVARTPQGYSRRGRGHYRRHPGRGAVRVQGARDRAGDERLGHRHQLAGVPRGRAGRAETLRQPRTGESDRDEAGIDRGALQPGTGLESAVARQGRLLAGEWNPPPCRIEDLDVEPDDLRRNLDTATRDLRGAFLALCDAAFKGSSHIPNVVEDSLQAAEMLAKTVIAGFGLSPVAVHDLDALATRLENAYRGRRRGAGERRRVELGVLQRRQGAQGGGELTATHQPLPRGSDGSTTESGQSLRDLRRSAPGDAGQPASGNRLERAGHGDDPPRVVAALSFGFWVSLLGPGGRIGAGRKANYAMTPWRPALRGPFAHRATLTRKEAHRPLNALRTLRNRFAHHEPVFARDLARDHERIVEVLGWSAPGPGDGSSTIAGFPRSSTPRETPRRFDSRWSPFIERRVARAGFQSVLALVDPQVHPSGIDIGDLEPTEFSGTKPRDAGGHQHGAVPDVSLEVRTGTRTHRRTGPPVLMAPNFGKRREKGSPRERRSILLPAQDGERCDPAMAGELPELGRQSAIPPTRGVGRRSKPARRSRLLKSGGQFYTPIGGRDSTPFDDNANQPVGTNGTMPLDA